MNGVKNAREKELLSLKERVGYIKEAIDNNMNSLKSFGLPSIESTYLSLKDIVNNHAEKLGQLIEFLDPCCDDRYDNPSKKILTRTRREVRMIKESLQKDVPVLVSREPEESPLDYYVRNVQGVLLRVQFLLPMLAELESMRRHLFDICDSMMPSDASSVVPQ